MFDQYSSGILRGFANLLLFGLLCSLVTSVSAFDSWEHLLQADFAEEVLHIIVPATLATIASATMAIVAFDQGGADTDPHYPDDNDKSLSTYLIEHFASSWYQDPIGPEESLREFVSRSLENLRSFANTSFTPSAWDRNHALRRLLLAVKEIFRLMDHNLFITREHDIICSAMTELINDVNRPLPGERASTFVTALHTYFNELLALATADPGKTLRSQTMKSYVSSLQFAFASRFRLPENWDLNDVSNSMKKIGERICEVIQIEATTFDDCIDALETVSTALANQLGSNQTLPDALSATEKLRDDINARFSSNHQSLNEAVHHASHHRCRSKSVKTDERYAKELHKLAEKLNSKLHPEKQEERLDLEEIIDKIDQEVDWMVLAATLGLPHEVVNYNEFVHAAMIALADKGHRADPPTPTPPVQGLSKTLRECFATCPPAFNGVCDSWFQWKTGMRRALASELATTDPFGTVTFALLASCFCGTFADWFFESRETLVASLSASSTVASALAAFEQQIESMLGVSDRDIKSRRLQAWECPNITANCWADFNLQLQTLALEAGLSPASITTQKLMSTLPAWSKKRLAEYALTQGMESELDLTPTMIANALRVFWHRQQKLPEHTPCNVKNPDGSCPKGKGAACKCAPSSSAAPLAKDFAPLSSPRSYPPSCNTHRYTPQDVFDQILKNKRAGAPGHGKWCDEVGICEMCMGIKNAAKYNAAFPNGGPPGRARSERSGTRQPSQ